MIKSSQRLKTVLKLATLRQTQAAKQLGEKLTTVAAQEQQLQQLQSYQLDYDNSFKSDIGHPTHAVNLNNYQLFFSNLDSAINTQYERHGLAESELDQCRAIWQSMYARQKSMQVLIDKKVAIETREEENKLQRTLDDRVISKKDES